jgi:hypothetical protein
MAKRGTRRRGGAWYNPFTWFSTAPATLPENPTASPVPSPVPTASVPENPPPYGGKKRKTRRGGRRQRNLSKKIYGSY